jgi:hypothetical protein
MNLQSFTPLHSYVGASMLAFLCLLLPVQIRYVPVGEQLQDLLDFVRSRFNSFQLHQFEALAANLARLGHCPAADWWGAFER